jgi:hypothetical protein
MDNSGLNIPKPVAFLCCQRVQQDIVTKNYDLSNVFQGFRPPGFPFGTEFVTFTRFFHEGEGEFQVDITLTDEKGEKVTENQPRKLTFKDTPIHDLLTGWRVVFPKAGIFTFKVFVNNLNAGEYHIFCR